MPSKLTFAPSLARTLPKVVWHLDEPSDSLAVVMYYLSELTSHEVKVVLGGDGGDELFWGYDRYYGNDYASYCTWLPNSVRTHLFGQLLALLPEGFWYRSFTHKLRWIQHISSYQGAQRYSKSLNYFYFSDGFGKSLYTDTFRKRVSLFDPEASIKYYFNADNSINSTFLISTSEGPFPVSPVNDHNLSDRQWSLVLCPSKAPLIPRFSRWLLVKNLINRDTSSGSIRNPRR